MIGIDFMRSYIDMKFLNGTIRLSGTHGGYVISSGCGSGKTTVIKSLIHERFQDGVLYSAGTIQECDEMYEWLMKNAVGVTNSSGYTLKPEEVMLLHSKNGESRYAYMIEPESMIPKAKVVICTHYKFLHDAPEILLDQSFSRLESYENKTHVMRSITGDTRNIPRRWVLIDEMPTCDVLKVWFGRAAKLMMYEAVDLSIRHFDPELGDLVTDVADMRVKSLESRSSMMTRYNAMVKGTPIDPFNGFDNVPDNIPNRPKQLRKELLLDSFWNNEASKVKYPISTDFIRDGFIFHNISQFVNEDMMTKIIIFEGTGDLTFGLDNPVFTTLDLPKKYNTLCRVIKIDRLLDKRDLKNSWIRNHPGELDNMIIRCCESLTRILSENEKTLIVTWKNFKVAMNNKNPDEEVAIDTKGNYNPEFSLPMCITETLLGMGVPAGKFNVIHYKSGLDRSTNEFRDCDSIIFLGAFYVPNKVIDEFNSLYSSRSTPFRFSLYQLVQSVCRTRVRNHQGGEVRIYMTEDWNENTMKGLSFYFNKDLLPDKYSNEDLYKDLHKIEEGWYNNLSVPISLDLESEVTVGKLTKKWEPIVKLIDKELLPGLVDRVLFNRGPSEFIVSLDDIFRVYPMNDKKAKRYMPFINFLKKFGINLNIVREKDMRSPE